MSTEEKEGEFNIKENRDVIGYLVREQVVSNFGESLGDIISITHKTTIEVETQYVGTSASNQFGLIIDYFVAWLFQQDPEWFEIGTDVVSYYAHWPSVVKAYLLWAFYTRFSLVGRVSGSFIKVMPQFPLEYVVPNGFARLLHYIGAYYYYGVKYTPALATLENEPALGSIELRDDVTGIAETNYKQNTVLFLRQAQTYGEYVLIETGSRTEGFSIVYDQAKYINSWLNSLGSCSRFKDIPRTALDASYYSLVFGDRNLMVGFWNDDFDAEISLLIAPVRTGLSFTPPVMKSPQISYLVPSAPGGGVYEYNAYDQNARMYVLVSQNMERWFSKGWNFKGIAISGPALSWIRMAGPQFDANIQAAILSFIVSSHITSQDKIQQFIFALYGVSQALIARRAHDCGPVMLGHYWQKKVSPPSVRSIKLPLNLAALISNFGPIIKGNSLIIPFLDDDNAGTIDLWDKFLGGIQGSSNINQVNFFSYGAFTTLPMTFTVMGITLDSFWSSGLGFNRVSFPVRFIGYMSQWFNNIVSVPYLLDNFKEVIWYKWGSLHQLATTSYQIISSTEDLISSSYYNYGMYGFNIVTGISSFIPLDRLRVMKAFFMLTADQNSSASGSVAIINLSSFGINFYELINNFLIGMMTPGGSYEMSQLKFGDWMDIYEDRLIQYSYSRMQFEEIHKSLVDDVLATDD